MFTMFLAVVGFVLGLGALYWGEEDSLYNPKFSERVITYDIGGKVFYIPRNYISHGPSLSEKSKHILMMTLYPSFKGRNKSNDNEFKLLGWNRKIHFSIEEVSRKNTAEHMANLVLNKDKKYSYLNYVYSKSIDGFDLYKTPGFYDQYVSDSALVGERWRVFSCSEEDSKTPVPSPGCSSSFNLTDDIELHYSFSKEYLFQWRDIEEGLVSIIMGFKINKLN